MDKKNLIIKLFKSLRGKINWEKYQLIKKLIKISYKKNAKTAQL